MANHTKILMVCLGNICRSPLAEGLLRKKLNFTKFTVDSAGTNGSHNGESPDKRSVEIAAQHQLDISQQQSRKITKDDLEEFDYIYVMDDSNYEDVMALTTQDQRSKVKKILDAAFPDDNLNVPDPYYGGQQGFINVYNMLDQATDAIASQLEEK
jgi:protein-tyrosine phosphatase